MKSLETQLVEQEAEIKRLRKLVQDRGITEAGSGKRAPNTVDIVECYEGLGLSHQEAVKAAHFESAVVDLTEAQRQLIKNARAMGAQRCRGYAIRLGAQGIVTLDEPA